MCYCQWLLIAADAHNTWKYISSQIELSEIMKSNHRMPYNQKVNETIFVSLLHLFDESIRLFYPPFSPHPTSSSLYYLLSRVTSISIVCDKCETKYKHCSIYVCIHITQRTSCCYSKTKRLMEIVWKREWERVSQQNQMNEVSEHVEAREWKMPPVNHQIHASSQHIIDSKTFSMENELMRLIDANIAACVCVCVCAAIQSDSLPHHELDFTLDDGCRRCHHWMWYTRTDAHAQLNAFIAHAHM